MVKGKDELNALANLKAEDVGDGELKPWDRMYYANMQKERFYQVDEEAIAKYFPTQHVVTETMNIY